MDWSWVLLLPHILSFYTSLGSEVVVQVNTKKWIYYVPERFLSLTVDPLTLAAASPLTQESYNMAKGLSPSFVRIGGIGTNALIFGKEFMVNSSTVSESQWDSVNDFAKGTGLDIIASLNPSIRVQGVWDSQNSLELISYSNKKRHSVVWQLGYDVRGYNASGAEIGRDLVRLAKILDGFPKYAGSPIFSPDISSVTGAKQIHFVKDLLTTAGNTLGSIILQPAFMNNGELEEPEELISSMTNELDTYVWNKDVRVGKTIPKKPVWIAEPTASKGTFKDAVKFVKRIGVAARMGIQIYMRQAGAISLKSPTPDFWFSLLYKNLVGQGVLDNKIVSQNQTDVHMYAHCTASLPEERSILDSDWHYEKGAVTLFGVNESPEPVKLVMKVTSKEEPLHIYVLTSGEKNEKGVNPTLLNGQELMLSPTWDLPVLSPKVKRPSKSTSVILPGDSIFFIVMPDSKIRTCSVPPLVTPEFNLSELSKRLRLGPSRKSETLEDEQEIEPSEDLANDGVYVSFVKKKRHNVDDKNAINNDRLEIIGKSLMQTIISKLSPKKIEVKTKQANEEEMPVYITFNENSFLNKLAEGVKEELKAEDQLELDAQKDKYEPLTKAISKAELEESSGTSEPDIIKIEPVIPEENSEQDKSVSRMRRSSNEDPVQIIDLKEGITEPVKIEETTESSKSATLKTEEDANVDNLYHVSVTVIDPQNEPEKIDDKMRSSRHISVATDEDDSSVDGKKVAEAMIEKKEKDQDDAEDVQKKTLELAKVVQETEKVDRVSESSEGVVIPPGLPEEKVGEIMLETAIRTSEPEVNTGAVKDETSESTKDEIQTNSAMMAPVAPVEPSVSSGYSQVSTSGQSSTANTQTQIVAEQQSKVPIVTQGDLPQNESEPQLQETEPTSSQVEQPPVTEPTTSQILKISPPSSPNDNPPHGMFNVGNPEVSSPPIYNEQKETAINAIMTKIVNEANSKPRVAKHTDSQLVLVPVPGNETVLMESEDVKLMNEETPKDVKPLEQETSKDVRTLENGSPIELNEENEPKTIMPRQVSPKTPNIVKLSVTPLPQTATLSAPVEKQTTPAGPVSPFKSDNSLRSSQKEPLKAATPEELREKFKSLREKMLELRAQYLASREKRLEEIKKQVAPKGPAPSSDGDDPIKSSIKRREAELKEWFKRFDKRDAKSPLIVPLVGEVDKTRPRRFSLFSNDEGVDMAKFFEDEPSESVNFKRSPEMSGTNRHQHLTTTGDLVKLSPNGKRIFPLDSKTHGIVYNNKIYPAKLFSYVDQPDVDNLPKKGESLSTSADEGFEGLRDLETTETPKAGERIAFVPRDAFLREMKSDFIPVIIIPPDDSENGKVDEGRAKRSTLGSIEDQFHQLKEDLLPKISTWFKDLGDKAPWKRDLERSGRHRRSVEDFLRTNDIRTLLKPKILKKTSNLDAEEIQDLVVNNIDKGEDEMYAAAKKYGSLVDQIGDEVLTKEPFKRNSVHSESADSGYCEEIGTSKESVIRDPFLQSTSSDKKDSNIEVIKTPLNSTDSFEDKMLTSVIAEKISEFFTYLSDWFGISPTDSN